MRTVCLVRLSEWQPWTSASCMNEYNRPIPRPRYTTQYLDKRMRAEFSSVGTWWYHAKAVASEFFMYISLPMIFALIVRSCSGFVHRAPKALRVCKIQYIVAFEMDSADILAKHWNGSAGQVQQLYHSCTPKVSVHHGVTSRQSFFWKSRKATGVKSHKIPAVAYLWTCTRVGNISRWTLP